MHVMLFFDVLEGGLMPRQFTREYAQPALHDMINAMRDELFEAQIYLKTMAAGDVDNFLNSLERAGDMHRAATLFFDAATKPYCDEGKEIS